MVKIRIGETEIEVGDGVNIRHDGDLNGQDLVIGTGNQVKSSNPKIVVETGSVAKKSEGKVKGRSPSAGGTISIGGKVDDKSRIVAGDNMNVTEPGIYESEPGRVKVRDSNRLSTQDLSRLDRYLRTMASGRMDLETLKSELAEEGIRLSDDELANRYRDVTKDDPKAKKWVEFVDITDEQAGSMVDLWREKAKKGTLTPEEKAVWDALNQ